MGVAHLNIVCSITFDQVLQLRNIVTLVTMHTVKRNPRSSMIKVSLLVSQELSGGSSLVSVLLRDGSLHRLCYTLVRQ